MRPSEIMELAMTQDRVRIAKIINMIELSPTVDAAAGPPDEVSDAET